MQKKTFFLLHLRFRSLRKTFAMKSIEAIEKKSPAWLEK